jgi:hypothetical protein
VVTRNNRGQIQGASKKKANKGHKRCQKQPDGQDIVFMSFAVDLDGAMHRNHTVDQRKGIVVVVE